jgi:hypothetical protein
VCAAFARVNHKEAADRKLAVTTLWYSTGRASEPGFLAYSGLKWNALHDAGAIESFQSEPSKLKFVVFIAAPTRHCNWSLDFADHLIFDRGMTNYVEGERSHLLPELAGQNSGTKINNYIKGLQPEGRPGSLKKYSDIVGGTVPSLPPQPTAAGVRPGAIDTLACSVPAELAVHNTGHDLTGLSALWDYMQVTPPRTCARPPLSVCFMRTPLLNSLCQHNLIACLLCPA